ncbi:hypothetical protein JYK00_04470 [Thermosipho ferrireducens]|uniref:Flagellar motor switch protein FliG middle domain-containing protein n=1 Tax=Thermosipho ferrireducens TaxID=2571116 RepID=A0ABX7S846_9BACT|nr:hypothetical protein [Thermosipho ferrireducens]QTA38767.1 hypothetical protein JYK00_04470 [Thermosipho ferrireducens]
MAKKPIIGKIIAFIIVILIFLNLFSISYFNFEIKRVYNSDAKIFQYWRSYVSYIFSKIPLLNKFIKYEPLKVLKPQDYFSTTLSQYKENFQKILEEARNTLNEAKIQEEKNQKMYSLLKAIEDEWKDKKIQEELQKVQKLTQPNKIDSLVEVFSNGDAQKLIPLMNSNEITPETLAVVFDKLSPELRSDMLQALASVNPTKAAQTANLMGSITEIKKELDDKISQLEERIRNLYELEKSIVSLEGFDKSIRYFISNLSENELIDLIFFFKDKPYIAYYIISKTSPQTGSRILQIIKEKDEKLFAEIISRSGNQ